MILRQVALVSYGTRFLRGALPLEEWYRHGIFFDARLQFRALAEHALLADDFTLWLGMLKRSGAVRLTLHPAVEFGIDLACAEHGGDYAVIAHCADSHQVWAVGKERAAWLEDPAFPRAASYGGELDSYWLVEDRPGNLDVPNTDWKQLSAVIAADLDINVPSSLAAAGLFFGPLPEQPDWARLPLFPSSTLAYPAHRLLATLDREQATFANDTNPKNEDSHYRQLDAAGAQAADNWGARLDSWVIEVQLRCANEYRESDLIDRNSPLARIYAPPPVAAPALDRPILDKPAGVAAPARDGKWLGRIAIGVAIVVLSLFVLCIANIVAAFPWLSILIALPCALYAKFRKE